MTLSLIFGSISGSPPRPPPPPPLIGDTCSIEPTSLGLTTMSRARLEASESALRSSGAKLSLKTLPGRGRSLVAARDLSEGEVLLTEEPVAFHQMPGNAEAGCMACAWCMRDCCTADEQMRCLGVSSKAPVSVPDKRPARAKKSARCGDCGALYCCSGCQEAHRVGRHAAFCSASEAHRAAYAEFVAFASATCHTQLLAAELVAASFMHRASCLVRGADADAPSSAGGADTDAPSSAGLAWEAEYVCAPWPSLVVLPPNLPRSRERQVRSACAADCERGRALLLAALTKGAASAILQAGHPAGQAGDSEGDRGRGAKRRRPAGEPSGGSRGRSGGGGSSSSSGGGSSSSSGGGGSSSSSGPLPTQLSGWLADWLSAERWQRLMGLATQNAAGITLPSAVRGVVERQLSAVVASARAGDAMDRPRLGRFSRDVEAAARAWHARQEEGEEEGGEEESEEEEGEEEEEEEEGEEEEGEEEEEEEEEEVGEEGTAGEGGEWQLPQSSPLVGDATRLAEAYNLLPEVEGSGLYPALALINHRCDANVAIQCAPRPRRPRPHPPPKPHATREGQPQQRPRAPAPLPPRSLAPPLPRPPAPWPPPLPLGHTFLPPRRFLPGAWRLGGHHTWRQRPQRLRPRRSLPGAASPRGSARDG